MTKWTIVKYISILLEFRRSLMRTNSLMVRALRQFPRDVGLNTATYFFLRFRINIRASEFISKFSSYMPQHKKYVLNIF